MNRLFSNGPSKDFVKNPFSQMLNSSSRVWIATPYVTEFEEVLNAVKKGTTVQLLVGLNAATSPAALNAMFGKPNLSMRYLTNRFHAKIYFSEAAALVGSSNLTDGGLLSNREATIHLDQRTDSETIDEIRSLFKELWESAPVLTEEKLRRFTKVHQDVVPKGPSPDDRIMFALGIAEPVNIRVGSDKKSRERQFLDQLHRQIYEEYRPAFMEVQRLVEEHGLRRDELLGIGLSNETNRFLNWVRLTQAVGEESWATAPLLGEAERRAEILRLGREWTAAQHNQVPDHYIGALRQVQSTFGTSSAVAAASKEEIGAGLMGIHAFSEQYRYVKEAKVEEGFWLQNNHDIQRVKRTITHLLYGGGDFCERLHDSLYDRTFKLGYIGFFTAIELYGTVRPDDCPPINGRMAKALKFLGFNVSGT